MIRYTNILGPIEKKAFMLQINRYAGTLLYSLEEELAESQIPLDLNAVILAAEQSSRVSCQLLRLLATLVEDGEVPYKRAARVTAFTARILQVIAKESHTASELDYLNRAIEKLESEGMGWAELIRVAETTDPLFPGTDFHFWSALSRNTIPAIEWVRHAREIESAPEHSLDNLTISQNEAVKWLRKFLQWKRTNQYVAGVWVRPIPLIVGPTGVGKSTIIKTFCANLGLKMMHLNPSAWVVTGAASKPWTASMIQDFIQHNEEGVIFVDEIDKFCSREGGWERSLGQELMALLDNRLPESIGWSATDRRRLSERFMIVGAGTWQADHVRRARSMGFNSVSETWDESCLDLSNQTSIPEELLRRFNPNLIHLAPPTRGEIMQRILNIHAALNQPTPSRGQLEELGTQAVTSGENTRWLEGYLSRVMFKECISIYDATIPPQRFALG